MKAYDALKSRIKIKGMAHITGGGIDGNLPRVFPVGVGAVINEGSCPVHPIFDLMRSEGNVPDADMKRTFNMGIGYILIVDPKDKEITVRLLKKMGFASHVIGSIQSGFEGVCYA